MASSGERPDLNEYRIVAVVPAYKVEREIGSVLASIPDYVRHIVVVNDNSPDGTAERVRTEAQRDPRILLVSHEQNKGVGGAMVTGFRKSLELDAQIVVKIDGDGQMPLGRIPDLVQPLIEGEADFTKGNRFRDFRALGAMPNVRRVGNAALSFLAKAATGYWNCFDPTNGFIALRSDLLRSLPLDGLDKSYFFEISLLSRAYLHDAVVRDVPIPARYGDEVSNMSVGRVILSFPPKLLQILIRRVMLKYFVYDFSLVSIYLMVGLPLLLFGLVFGGVNWIQFSRLGAPAPTGTIMLATLPIILGFQLLLSAIGIDIQSVPKNPRGRLA